ALRSDNDAVGMHQIVNGAALAQKFRITNYVEFRAAPIVTLDGFADALAGFDRNSTFIDDYPIIAQNISDLSRDFFDEAKIDIAVRLGRCRHRDENDLRLIDAFANATAEMQPMGGHIAMDDFFQARLVNWNSAGLQRFDFCSVIVNAIY